MGNVIWMLPGVKNRIELATVFCAASVAGLVLGITMVEPMVVITPINFSITILVRASEFDPLFLLWFPALRLFVGAILSCRAVRSGSSEEPSIRIVLPFSLSVTDSRSRQKEKAAVKHRSSRRVPILTTKDRTLRENRPIL